VKNEAMLLVVTILMTAAVTKMMRIIWFGFDFIYCQYIVKPSIYFNSTVNSRLSQFL